MMNSGSSAFRPVAKRATTAFLLAMAVAISGVLALGGTDAGAIEKLKIKQPKCGKLKKKGKIKQCKDNQLVRKAIGDAHFFGTRADGEAIDTVYCTNGVLLRDLRLEGEVPVNMSTVGWRVESAKVKNEESFTAVLYSKEGKADFIQSVSRKGDVWKLGITKGKKLKSLGEAERIDYAPNCATWGKNLLGVEPPKNAAPEEG